jgi:3-oxoacyl-[acyl-carrier-protein] synthase-3
MIYSDGAGAAILEGQESEQPVGILASAARTDTNPQAYYLSMNTSCRPEPDDKLYLKMEGHKLYQYALKHVPGTVKASLDRPDIKLMM